MKKLPIYGIALLVQALRVYGSNSVTVTGITIQDSRQTHAKFGACTSVQVSSFTTSSPGDSSNTDGIHLQNSQNEIIYSRNFAFGGQHQSMCFKHTVQDVKMQNTLTGVRMKTWQGGSGSVQQVMFPNIQVSEVITPIMIDQYYCDKSKCQNESSAVSVSDINYALCLQ